MDIINALNLLDIDNKNHWTADGLPRMDALVDMTGDESLSRKVVTDAAPGLTRESAEAQQGMTSTNTPPKESEPDVAPNASSSTTAQADELADLDPSESVLCLPMQDVLGHPDLTTRAIDEISAKVQGALKRKAAIEDELRQLYAKSEMLSRVQVQHDRAARRNGTKRTNVQDYLAAQARARGERVERAQKFIDAGTTVKDVAAQLSSSSKLDTAMRQRKPALGSQRPAARPPAQV